MEWILFYLIHPSTRSPTQQPSTPAFPAQPSLHSGLLHTTIPPLHPFHLLKFMLIDSIALGLLLLLKYHGAIIINNYLLSTHHLVIDSRIGLVQARAFIRLPSLWFVLFRLRGCIVRRLQRCIFFIWSKLRIHWVLNKSWQLSVLSLDLGFHW